MVTALLRRHVYSLTALAVVLLTGGAIWSSSGKPHYPVVRAAIPGGTTLTFIELPYNDAGKCEQAQNKVADALRAQCPSCRLDLPGCHQPLEASWENAFRGESDALFSVHTDTHRILIEASQATARETCLAMAAQINEQGKQRARCVTPRA